MEKYLHKFVNDLGLAAYILMHGYVVIGKKGRSIYFECENRHIWNSCYHNIQQGNWCPQCARLRTESKGAERVRLFLESIDIDFYTFDSCIMFLKKINEYMPEEINLKTHKTINDLGVAAYLLMHEYRPKSIGVKVIGKKGRYIYFEHPDGSGEDFERLSYQYLPSQFQTYDSNLMALKKIGEYMPRESS